MVALTVIAAASVPHAQAQATVRIVRIQRVNSQEWVRSSRKREIVLDDGDRRVRLRLIEFE